MQRRSFIKVMVIAIVRMVLACFAAAAAAVPGCAPRRERPKQVKSVTIAPPDKSKRIVLVLLDLSGSFEAFMADDGNAWKFACSAMDKYFRSTIAGPPDRLILAKISGSKKSIMFEGTPDECRKTFGAVSFRTFLKKQAQADPGGSLVYAGVAHALEYMMRIPTIRDHQAQSAVLILSDFLENGPDAERERRRLLDDLVAYKQLGGVGGMYYCDQLEYVKWRKDLDDAGLEDFIVECDFKGRPTLPDFQ